MLSTRKAGGRSTKAALPSVTGLSSGTDNQTVVEWYFKNEMNDGRVEEFDGLSLVVWTEDGQIQSLKEFGCNLHNYDPYQNGVSPQFREEPIGWF